MKKTIIKGIIAATLLVFVACSNPLDRPYNEETLQEDIEVLVARDKVYKDDLMNLSSYIIKCKITGEPLEGKTYRELIKEADEYARKVE